MAGAPPACIAGALLATNYVFVMYNRAAIMEATMVAFMVAAWYCYVRAQERPAWGAAAACLRLARVLHQGGGGVLRRWRSRVDAVDRRGRHIRARIRACQRRGRRSIADARGARAVAGLRCARRSFVAPNWEDYRFYNWQMSVTRKPSYDLKALMDRASWFPVLHDLLHANVVRRRRGDARRVAALGRWRDAAGAGAAARVCGWRSVRSSSLMHDVGNERRFVFFIPALIAMAAIADRGTAGWRSRPSSRP